LRSVSVRYGFATRYCVCQLRERELIEDVRLLRKITTGEWQISESCRTARFEKRRRRIFKNDFGVVTLSAVLLFSLLCCY